MTVWRQQMPDSPVQQTASPTIRCDVDAGRHPLILVLTTPHERTLSIASPVGAELELEIQYAVHPTPERLAQGFSIGRELICRDCSALALGWRDRGWRVVTTGGAGNYRCQQNVLDRRQPQTDKLPKGVAWLDTAIHESLRQASKFVQPVGERQRLMIGCPERGRGRMRFIAAWHCGVCRSR